MCYPPVSMDAHLSQTELDDLLAQARVERHEGQTSFTLELAYRVNCLFLVIKGKVLMPIIPDEFIATVRRLMTEGGGDGVAIDLRECTYFSSGAISFIVTVFRDAIDCGQQVVIVEPPTKARKIIEILGLNACFLMVEDEATAIAYLEAQRRARQQSAS